MQATSERCSAAHSIAVRRRVLRSDAVASGAVDGYAPPCAALHSTPPLCVTPHRTAMRHCALLAAAQQCNRMRRSVQRWWSMRHDAARCGQLLANAGTRRAQRSTALHPHADENCAVNRAAPPRMPMRRTSMQCKTGHVLHCIACIAVHYMADMGAMRYMGGMQYIDSSASSGRGAIGAIAGSGDSETNIGYRKGSPEK